MAKVGSTQLSHGGLQAQNRTGEAVLLLAGCPWCSERWRAAFLHSDCVTPGSDCALCHPRFIQQLLNSSGVPCGGARHWGCQSKQVSFYTLEPVPGLGPWLDLQPDLKQWIMSQTPKAAPGESRVFPDHFRKLLRLRGKLMGSGLSQAWVQVPPLPPADCVTVGQSQSLLGFPVGGRALGVAGVGGRAFL